MTTLSTGNTDFVNSCCILSLGVPKKEQGLPSFHTRGKGGLELQSSLLGSHIVTEGDEVDLSQS